MGLDLAHAVLKQRIVINGGRDNLFIRPALKHGQRGLFDSAAPACFFAKIIAGAAGNPGKGLRHRRPHLPWAKFHRIPPTAVGGLFMRLQEEQGWNPTTEVGGLFIQPIIRELIKVSPLNVPDCSFRGRT